MRTKHTQQLKHAFAYEDAESERYGRLARNQSAFSRDEYEDHFDSAGDWSAFEEEDLLSGEQA